MNTVLHARAKLVAAYRQRAASWPDGVGAWYRDEDWGLSPRDGFLPLTATGAARAKALGPWANDRAEGRQCPDLVLGTLTVPTGALGQSNELGTPQVSQAVADCLDSGMSLRETAAHLGLSKSAVYRLSVNRQQLAGSSTASVPSTEGNE